MEKETVQRFLARGVLAAFVGLVLIIGFSAGRYYERRLIATHRSEAQTVANHQSTEQRSGSDNKGEQSNRIAEFEAIQQELLRFKHKSEMHRAASEVFRLFNMSNEEHRHAFKVVNNSLMWGEEFWSVQRKAIQVDGAILELILLQGDSLSSPGFVGSVAVLVSDNELVDVVFRESNTRSERHEAQIEDFDNDGAIDLTLHCSPSDSEEFTIAYTLTSNGFLQQ